MNQVEFVTLDPGHFHAALVLKEMYRGASKKVHVYAPLGPDLLRYLQYVHSFNTRGPNPTSWELDIYTGKDFRQRMIADRRGNLVIISGRNRGKIDYIKTAVAAGLNVLADKPWIIDRAQLQKLESTLELAEQRGLIAYDIMTERHEITSVLQAELAQHQDIFGAFVVGTETDPGLYMQSLHYLLKMVAGSPNLRPAWYFDVEQQGEGLVDVGTHLVDLAQCILHPDKPVNYRDDITVLSAKHWPTVLTKSQFQRVTGESDFPDFLATRVRGNEIDYYGNAEVSYVLRGIHVKLRVIWNFEATADSGDTHLANVKGTRSRIEVRQGPEQKYRPELYVVPNVVTEKGSILASLQKKISTLRARYPGVVVEDHGSEFLIAIPDQLREGHEAHFARVTNRFLQFSEDPKTLPSWEKPNMLAKYFVTTTGLALSRRQTDTT